jgi:tight adherence protein C
MTAVALLLLAAGMLGIAAGVEILAGRPAAAERRDRGSPEAGSEPAVPHQLLAPAAVLLARLGLARRLARAGMAGRISLPALVAAKLGGAVVGLLAGAIASPAAPGRLSLVVALAMPAAGFLAPDAWLERRARARLRSMRAALPDALDLLSVGASAGRSPVAGLAEIGAGEGPLAGELAVLAAEASCGAPQRELLGALRGRVPIPEVAGLCGLIERSRRFGSPLAEQLREQASGVRATQRRRTEEHAARAAPKIQLAVALLLVPSVLLMIAAGLLANVDRFLAGL